MSTHKVTIRDDLEVGEKYGGDTFTNNMRLYKGQEVTVVEAHLFHGSVEYHIMEDAGMWSWTSEMFKEKDFRLRTSFRPGDQVRVKPLILNDVMNCMKVTRELAKFSGQEGIITKVYSKGAWLYCLDNCPYAFTAPMLEYVGNSARWKPGDVVKFRDDLEENKNYDGITFLSMMKEFKGKPFTICETYSCGEGYVTRYKLFERPIICTESMLEPYKEEKIMQFRRGDRARVKIGIIPGSVCDEVVVFTDGMAKYAGKIVTIAEVNEIDGIYYLKEDGKRWVWSPHMLIPAGENETDIEELSAGDIVRVVPDLVSAGTEVFDYGVACPCTEEMKAFAGKIVTIAECLKSDPIPKPYRYHIKEDGGKYIWSISMFTDPDMEEDDEESEFEVGDIVHIRKDLKLDTLYDGVVFSSPKDKYSGMEVTISQVCQKSDGGIYYNIREDGEEWNWSSAMFEEGLKEGKKEETKNHFMPGDRVRVREDISPNTSIGSVVLSSSMKNFLGKVVTISSAIEMTDGVFIYHIEEDDGEWNWASFLFEGIVEEKAKEESEEESEEKKIPAIIEYFLQKNNLEIGRKFFTTGEDAGPYYFDEAGELYDYSSGHPEKASDSVLLELFLNKRKISGLKRTLAEGDSFWTVNYDGSVDSRTYMGFADVLALVLMGNVFLSKEDAFEARDSVLKKFRAAKEKATVEGFFF